MRQSRSHAPAVHPRIVAVAFVFYICTCILYLLAPFFYGFQDLAVTVTGTKYVQGSCYTGCSIRSVLLETPYRNRYILCRILLALERVPYIAFSIAGLGLATGYALLQLSNLDYYFAGMDPLYAYLSVFLAEVTVYVLLVMPSSLVIYHQWRRARAVH